MANTSQKPSLTGAILAHQLTSELSLGLQNFQELDQVLVGWNGKQTVGEVERWLSKHDIQNAQIIHLPTLTHFAEGRNQLLAAAKTAWVIFLDSDEKFTEKIAWSELLEQLPAGSVGAFQRDDYFLGKRLYYGEVGNVWVARLVPAIARFERSVHEVLPADWQEVPLKPRIEHRPHQSISSFLQKVAKYANLDAQQRIEDGMGFSAFEMLIFPPSKFVMNYVVRLGFLDGWQGLVYAVMMSLHSLMTRIFVYERTR